MWTLVVAVAAVTLAVGIAGDAVPVEISSVFIPVLIVFATPFYGVVGAIGFLDPLVALVVFVGALGGPAASRPGWPAAAGRGGVLPVEALADRAVRRRA